MIKLSLITINLILISCTNSNVNVIPSGIPTNVTSCQIP